MRTQLKEVEGIDWGDAAVMNCRWKGPRLRDVLKHAGVEDQEKQKTVAKTDQLHVAFACNAVKVEEDDWYGASVPLDRAMKHDADIILALEVCGIPRSFFHTDRICR